MRHPATVLAFLLLLPACTGDGRPAPSPSADPDAAARERLVELTEAAADATFDASYRFTARGGESGTIRLRQAPPQYRIDITLQRTSSFFALTSGIVSCTELVSRKGFSCFLVARPGEPVPDLFDPGVQRLFRDAVADLAANPEDYRVRAAEAPSPPSGVPAGECFRVRRAASPTPSPGAGAPDGFEDGTYCFSEQGVPTRFDVATGSLEIERVGPAPGAAAFRPPTRPVTLPSLTPSPSPARS